MSSHEDLPGPAASKGHLHSPLNSLSLASEREQLVKMVQEEVIERVFGTPIKEHYSDRAHEEGAFREALGKLIFCQFTTNEKTYYRALDVLRELARRPAQELRTITQVARVLDTFLRCAPSEELWDKLEDVFVPKSHSSLPVDLTLQGVADVFLQANPTRPSSLNKALKLCHKAKAIFMIAGLSDAHTIEIASVLATMGANRGNFRGIEAVKRLYVQLPQGVDSSVVTLALRFGISSGDSIPSIIQGINRIIPTISNQKSAGHALREALIDQFSNHASIVSVLHSFARSVCEVPKVAQELQSSTYRAFLSDVRNLHIRVDGIEPHHLSEYVRQGRVGYATAYAMHIIQLDNLIEQLIESGRIEGGDKDPLVREMSSQLQTIVCPELLQVFGEYVQAVRNGYVDVSRGWKAISTMVNDSVMTPAHWSGLRDVLSHQHWPLRRDMTEVLEVVQRILTGANYQIEWLKYINTVNLYRDYIADLRCITPEVVEYHYRNNQNIQAEDLLQVMDVANRIYLSDACRHFFFSELMDNLLKQEGPTGLFSKAYASDDFLGTIRRKSARVYWTVQDLANAGLYEDLVEIVEHQVSRGHGALEAICGLDNVRASIDENFTTEKDKQRAWAEYRAMRRFLQDHDVPLEGFTYAVYEGYHRNWRENTSAERLKSHLIRAHRLFSNNSSESYTVFVRSLCQQAPNTAALQVVELLTDKDSAGSIPPARLAERIGASSEFPPKGWLSIGRYVEMYRENKLPLEPLVDWAVALDKQFGEQQKGKDHLWSVAEEVFVELREVQMHPYLLSGDFVASYDSAPDDIKPLLCICLKTMTEFNARLIARSEEHGLSILRDSLTELCQKNFGLTDNPAMVYKLRLMLLKGGITSLDEYRMMLRELKMHALTDIMRSSPDAARREWARRLIGVEFNMGGPPYVEGDPMKKVVFNETMEVVDRAIREGKGFGAVAIDARGTPKSEDLESVSPFLMRFALDCAEDVRVVNSSDNNSFPGKGFYMGRMKVHQIFTSDSAWEQEGKSSPFWRWEEQGGLFSSKYFYNCKVERLTDTGFIMMRGVKIVIPPRDAEHLIDGEHYSYVLYNRHFYPGPHVAIGVSTDVLQSLLQGALIPADDFVGFSPKQVDVSKVDLSYAGLLDESMRCGKTIMDLTYGSVIGTGLCNVFPPFSSPYYSWEMDAIRAFGWRDSWGHVHKAFLIRYEGDEDRLEVFRELHTEVYHWARTCQDYLAAWQFALSFYKMGTTLAHKDDTRQDQTQAGESELEFEFREATSVHTYRYRMLEEAYRWFKGGREQGWTLSKMPVLHFAYTIDPNSIPTNERRKFELDTATMVLRVGGEEIQLPQDGNGMGEREREIWRTYVVPFFEQESTGWEPRFLLRDGAFSLYE